MTVHVYPEVQIKAVAPDSSPVGAGEQTDVRATLQTEFGNTPEQPVDLTASVRTTGKSSDRQGHMDPSSTSSSGQETVGFTYTASKRGTTDTVTITSNAPTSTDSGETEITVRPPELEIENIDVDPNPVGSGESTEVTVTVKTEFGETPLQKKRLTAHDQNAGSDMTPVGRYKTVRMTPEETEELTGVDTSNPDSGTIGELNRAIRDDPYISSISPIPGSHKWRVVKTYDMEYISNDRIGALTGVDTSNPDTATIGTLNRAVRDDPEFISISPDPNGHGWFVKTSVNYQTELMSPGETEELTGVDTSNPDTGTIGELNDAIRDDPAIVSIRPNPHGHGWFVQKNTKNLLDGADTVKFRHTAPKWDDVREQYPEVDDETEVWDDWIQYRIDGTKKTSDPINVARPKLKIDAITTIVDEPVSPPVEVNPSGRVDFTVHVRTEDGKLPDQGADRVRASVDDTTGISTQKGSLSVRHSAGDWIAYIYTAPNVATEDKVTFIIDGNSKSIDITVGTENDDDEDDDEDDDGSHWSCKANPINLPYCDDGWGW
jgi:glycine cleavage system H lipoate-binding protein